MVTGCPKSSNCRIVRIVERFGTFLGTDGVPSSVCWEKTERQSAPYRPNGGFIRQFARFDVSTSDSSQWTVSTIFCKDVTGGMIIWGSSTRSMYSTHFGSNTMNRTASGVFVATKPAMSELRHIVFPCPVAPPMRTCGNRASSRTTSSPNSSTPRRRGG